MTVMASPKWFIEIVLLGLADTRQRSSWPELVRVDGKSAKQIIENSNHLVTGVILPPGELDFLDICCNRVVIYVDDKGITIKVQ